MKCEDKNTHCSGRAKKRLISQPYYHIPETEISLCDYHAHNFGIERFWVGSIKEGKYLPKDYFSGANLF